MSRILFGAVALSCLAAPALAEESAKPLRYLGALGTYAIADDERLASIDYSTGLQLLYGYQWTDSRWGLEGSFFFDNYETEEVVRTDFYRTGLGLDLVYAFGDRTGFTPFVLAGLGFAYNDVLPDSNDDENFVANIGAGFVTAPLTENGFIRVRGEGRYIYDDFADGLYDIRFGLGLEFSLGRRAPAPVVEERVEVVQVRRGHR
jgi:OmpA-OmpF porin, OOP family